MALPLFKGFVLEKKGNQNSPGDDHHVIKMIKKPVKKCDAKYERYKVFLK